MVRNKFSIIDWNLIVSKDSTLIIPQRDINNFHAKSMLCIATSAMFKPICVKRTPIISIMNVRTEKKILTIKSK